MPHLLDWSIISLLVIVAVWRAGSQLGALAGLEGDTPAPAVTLVSLDGHESHLPHAPGKVTVVSFWATWCGEWELGPDLWVGRATPQLRAAFGGVPGVPTTFVIDRAGKIRHRFFGPLSTVALRTAVVRLLERPS